MQAAASIRRFSGLTGTPGLLQRGKKNRKAEQFRELDSPGKALYLRARKLPHLFRPNDMANIKSAEKRARQTLTRTLRNKAARTRVKNTRKSAYDALKAGAADSAARVSALASAADKAAKRGVIHRNKANRLKARAAKAAKAAKA